MEQESRGHLVVSEVFGPTIQGEGPSAGRRAGFVRLGGCNLACTWCDTPYTWDWTRFDRRSELTRTPVVDLVDRITAMDVPLVVVTGGEPLLQRRGLAALLDGLLASGCVIEVETNGTLVPDPGLSREIKYNVSPKLANSGLPLEARIRPTALSAFSALDSTFKFVVVDEDDLEEVAQLVGRFALGDVWISPEGTRESEITERAERISAQVQTNGWSLSPRLHILLWGNQRGH